MKRVVSLIIILICCAIAYAQSNLDALIKAAEKGDITVQKYLAHIYMNGDFGCPKSPRQAYKWFLAAAKQGDSESQYYVGKIILTLEGESDRMRKAIDWCMRSAYNGYAPAQVHLAATFMETINDKELGEYSRKNAFNLLCKAAKQSYPPAYLYLGDCYYFAIGVPQNINEALKYYKLADENGDKTASLRIADCYAFNIKDYVSAFVWYQKAIDEGIVEAYRNISSLYALGNGVKKDMIKAHEMIDTAIAKSPNNPDYYDSKGALYLMEGKIDKAREMWNIVLKLDSKALERDDALAMEMIDNIDNNIPQWQEISSDTYVLIIANENYKRVEFVPYATNDGKVFSEYCKRTLGIPEQNIIYVEDATLGDIIYNINILDGIAKAYNGDTKIIVYYAGHGIPDPATNNGYLLPTDGYSNNVSSCLSLNKLYEDLGKIPAKLVLVLIDACFSGAKRDGSMIASARGTVIKPRLGMPKGNIFVMTAASGDETACSYEDKKHGLFTYFLLKKLHDSDGDITLGELSDFVISNVKQQSILINKKGQTPSIIHSEKLSDNWRSIKIR